MTLSIVSIHVALLALSALITGVLAIFAWRRRLEPGAAAFAALLVGMTIWSGAYLVGVLTLDPQWRLVWLKVGRFGSATVPMLYLLFALSYTGHDEFISRRSIAALGVIPALTILLGLTNQWHHLLNARIEVHVVEGIALVESWYGPWFFVYLAYAYVSIIVGSALLVRLVFRSDYLFADQSAVLLAGAAAPLVANAISITGSAPLPGFDMTPYAFIVTGIAFGYALFRRRLFDLVPATRQLGRRMAIGQIDEGVTILDRDHRVVYANGAAADLLGRPPDEAVGSHVEELVADLPIDFDARDALATVEVDDRVLEVRASPVTDRHERTIGHTLVAHDVTARERRERKLARQHDDLEAVNRLNAVIRGVNQALVGAHDRPRISEAVCQRLADSELYTAACMADAATWRGDGDRWTLSGAATEPPAAPGWQLPVHEERSDPVIETDGGTTGRRWVIVPVTYGASVFGGIGVQTERERVSSRERNVLEELGELVGHALDAVQRRQLLTAARVVELELTNGDGALAGVSEAIDCRLEMVGIVAAGDGRVSVYLRVEGASPSLTRDQLDATAEGRIRIVGDGAAASVLEWTTDQDSLPALLDQQAGRIEAIRADDGRTTYELTVPSDGAVRTILAAVQESYPETALVAKRTSERSFDDGVLPAAGAADLTDRQRESLEAAYRAGYFDWPRESTAEDVADALGIASSTLHGHLRKAERAVFEAVLDGGKSEKE